VGSGPFPTELHDAVGEQIRRAGQEFGSTTGRPRRTGWLDMPALNYACMLNGVTQLMMMKADVLAGRPEVAVCQGYHIGTEYTAQYPAGPEAALAVPEYTFVGGWEPCATPAKYDALPDGLQRYVALIEQSTGLPITLVSNGPDRVDTILRGL